MFEHLKKAERGTLSRHLYEIECTVKSAPYPAFGPYPWEKDDDDDQSD